MKITADATIPLRLGTEKFEMQLLYGLFDYIHQRYPDILPKDTLPKDTLPKDISVRQNVHSAKYPFGKMSIPQNVHSAKRPSANCPFGKVSFGKMSGHHTGIQIVHNKSKHLNVLLYGAPNLTK
jgi:hypothetical protein